MPVVSIEPTDEHPVPYGLEADTVPTLLEQLAVAGNTAELQQALGATIELSKAEEVKQRNLLEEVIEKKKTSHLQSQPTALAAASFLREYGANLALDVASTRAAITNKLMEIANCGDPKYELKALELLGKHSDIGLFTDRSEVTINYKDPSALEDAIKEKLRRVLHGELIDVTPVNRDLDEKLGVFVAPEPVLSPLAAELGPIEPDPPYEAPDYDDEAEDA